MTWGSSKASKPVGPNARAKLLNVVLRSGVLLLQETAKRKVLFRRDLFPTSMYGDFLRFFHLECEFFTPPKDASINYETLAKRDPRSLKRDTPGGLVVGASLYSYILCNLYIR